MDLFQYSKIRLACLDTASVLEAHPHVQEQLLPKSQYEPQAYRLLNAIVRNNFTEFSSVVMSMLDCNNDGKLSEGEYLQGIMFVIQVVIRAQVLFCNS